MSLSTHVLDAVLGRPASGMGVILHAGAPITSGVTDDDGRIGELAPGGMAAGVYGLTFATGDWFAAQRRETFYPEVTITFRYGGSGHLHVPILLSPYSFTTYRGS